MSLAWHERAIPHPGNLQVMEIGEALSVCLATEHQEAILRSRH
jgi:hypothetical protein